MPPRRARVTAAPVVQPADSDDDESKEEEAVAVAAATATADNATQLEPPDANTMRILLATDNHLGYNFTDAIRGSDSFCAFNEILHLAVCHKADCVLLAGDLFHDNRPSRGVLYTTCQLLRRAVTGTQSVLTQTVPPSNTHDPYQAVSLPIYAIHGNHDDPVRESGQDRPLAALDLLDVTKLVNYIGRQGEIDNVTIKPMLMKKGRTNVALYGLGSMRDERLHRMWQAKKVKFLQTAMENHNSDDEDNHEDDNEEAFFNLFALHQNRDVGRGAKNCIKESMIPEWMDVVVWGHEHESLIDLHESDVGSFRITQPGSSVATSLVPGEASRKHVGLLDVRGKEFRLTSIPLTQVRPFQTTELCLQDFVGTDRLDADNEEGEIEKQVTALLREEVSLLIHQAKEKRQQLLRDAQKAGNNYMSLSGGGGDDARHFLKQEDLPLVRIRVEHTGFTTLNNQRFGSSFVGKVANPEDILLFHRRKKQGTGATRRRTKEEAIPPEELVKTDMEDLVTKFLQEQQLQLFSEKRLGEAMEEFVEKNSTAIIDEASDKMLEIRQQSLIDKNVAGADSSDEKAKKDHSAMDEEEEPSDAKENSRDASDDESDQARPKKATKKKPTRGKKRAVSVYPDSEEEEEKEVPKKSAKKATTTKRGKKKSAVVDLVDDDDDDDGDDDDDFVDDPKPTARKTKARVAPGDTKRKAARRKQMMTTFDSDDDDEEMVVLAPKKKRKMMTTKTTPKKRKKRPTFDDDSDDDVATGRKDDDDDDDWGTNVTKSQY